MRKIQNKTNVYYWVYISQLLTFFFSELQETKLQFFICLFYGRNKLPRFLNPLKYN